MSNNQAIQILRTTGNGITDSIKDVVLLAGQPFYNRQKNYLTIGDGSKKVNALPITVPKVEGYHADRDVINNITNANSKYIIGPNPDSDGLMIEDKGGSLTLRTSNTKIFNSGKSVRNEIQDVSDKTCFTELKIDNNNVKEFSIGGTITSNYSGLENENILAKLGIQFKDSTNTNYPCIEISPEISYGDISHREAGLIIGSDIGYIKFSGTGNSDLFSQNNLNLTSSTINMESNSVNISVGDGRLNVTDSLDSAMIYIPEPINWEATPISLFNTIQICSDQSIKSRKWNNSSNSYVTNGTYQLSNCYIENNNAGDPTKLINTQVESTWTTFSRQITIRNSYGIEENKLTVKNVSEIDNSTITSSRVSSSAMFNATISGSDKDNDNLTISNDNNLTSATVNNASIIGEISGSSYGISLTYDFNNTGRTIRMYKDSSGVIHIL